MSVSEYRNKSVEELKTELVALLKEQFNLRMQKKIGQETAPKPHAFGKVRLAIARIKTILKEKGSKV